MTARATEKPAARATRTKQEEENGVEVNGISRREFLFYIWGASMVMLMGAGAGTLIWYLLPRFRAGEFGGDFPLSGTALPIAGAPPQDNPQGRFWLSHTDEGQVMALYKVCTHLGCLFKWVPTNNRFECPCHGSKFMANGLYIEGPAPRGLDRFEVTVVLNNGTELVSDANGIVDLADPAQVSEFIVHTGQKISGPPAGVEEYTSA
ncbi:MAG: Rieske 2Fe-2S domain-containing protein [Anaerolineae bacterium]|nr:Rieske 2Fe-2S domain-containing protein [Anaerolineae bacterium]